MRRDQLEHAIRTACQIIGRPEVIVVGSQSILGTYCEDQLPADATMSVEVDILPIAEDNLETARLADLIEGAAAVVQGSSRRSRNCTASASTASTWRPLRFPKADAPAWSRSRTPTRPLCPASRSSPGGASTRKTCAWPSSARFERRTATSWRRSCEPTSWTRRSSSPGCSPCRSGIGRLRIEQRTG